MPATPPFNEKPVHVLGISVSEDEPDDVLINVQYEGLYYAFKPETGYQWNREGFRLLHQIFQMTIAELSRRDAPEITSSK